MVHDEPPSSLVEPVLREEQLPPETAELVDRPDNSVSWQVFQRHPHTICETGVKDPSSYTSIVRGPMAGLTLRECAAWVIMYRGLRVADRPSFDRNPCAGLRGSTCGKGML